MCKASCLLSFMTKKDAALIKALREQEYMSDKAQTKVKGDIEKKKKKVLGDMDVRSW